MIGVIKNTGVVRKPTWREKIKAKVRELRRNQTKSEILLWSVLRNRKILGKKLYRQYPIIHFINRRPYYFIADFYCYESKLVIEIDGNVHDVRQDYDEQRTMVLKELGITVLRIKNEELEDLPEVIKKISEYL